MRELPTPLDASAPEPTTMSRLLPMFLQNAIPTFINELERVTTHRSPFKMPWSNLVRKFLIHLVQSGGSGGLEAEQEPEPSGSGRSSGGVVDVVETTSKVSWVTRSATKQTPGGSTSSLPKRPILSLAKGSSSKRSKN